MCVMWAWDAYLSQSPAFPHSGRFPTVHGDALLFARLAGPGEAWSGGLGGGADEGRQDVLLGAETAVLVIVVGGVDGRRCHIHAQWLVQLNRIMIRMTVVARRTRSVGWDGSRSTISRTRITDGIEAAKEILQCLVWILAGMGYRILLAIGAKSVSRMCRLTIAIVVLLLDGLSRRHFTAATIILGHFSLHYDFVIFYKTILVVQQVAEFNCWY